MGLYANLADALARAIERTSAADGETGYLTELLQLSAGIQKSDGTTEYRPFFVSAKWLEQSRREQTLKRADQSEFTGQATPIASLLALQAALDQALIVPLGFEAITSAQKAVSSNELELLKAAHDAALLTLKKYLPRS